MAEVKIPTPIGLLQEKGVIGQILRQLPRELLEAADQQNDSWAWLAARVGNGDCWPNCFYKALAAAASQRESMLRLVEAGRGSGSIANSWRDNLQSAINRGDKPAIEHWTDKISASILQMDKGRQWLLENNLPGLSSPATMRDEARMRRDKFYQADVRRLGRSVADKKWNGDRKPKLKTSSNSDYVATAMTMGWLTIGQNGFPGLCFMSDELIAELLGNTLPWPQLLNEEIHGWKTIRTIRQRLGLKKAEILFSKMEKVGDEKWAVLDSRGEKTHWIQLNPKRSVPPK